MFLKTQKWNKHNCHNRNHTQQLSQVGQGHLGCKAGDTNTQFLFAWVWPPILKTAIKFPVAWRKWTGELAQKYVEVD